ncbi:hypothetical protein C6N01_13280 [Enterococcus faecalis]|uniref:hypothetical protein n=1 Tax=Enterococcus faecalis TaxID=1351 RepID=UPI0013642FB9|nr:hypothetical protein [Enterococcus faecalis]NBJ47178.1 hypothetical protein [Enterococcus faecalis]
MINKKIVTSALTSMMLVGSFGFMSLASADNLTTRVEYEYMKPGPSSYTMIIPEKLSLHDTETSHLSIKTKDRDIRDGEIYAVSLSSGLTSDGVISLKHESLMFYLNSSVTKEDGTLVSFDNPEIGEFSGVEPNEMEVSKLLLGAPEANKFTKEGTYSTNITFKVSKK